MATLPSAWGGAGLGLMLLWAATAAWPFVIFYNGVLELPAVLGGIAVLWLFKLVALGGLYRTFIFGRNAAAEGRGPGGLQFGATEVRLLFATVLIALFMAMIAVAGLLVFAIAFNFSGLANGYNNSLAGWHAALMRHHTAADWAFSLLPLVLVAFLVFVGLKVVLAPVATVAERRLVTLNALGLSAGNVGKLFIGLLVVSLPFLVIVVLAMHLLSHSSGGVPAHMVMHAVAAALAIGAMLPLQTGFLASAYRQIVDLRAK